MWEDCYETKRTTRTTTTSSSACTYLHGIPKFPLSFYINYVKRELESRTQCHLCNVCPYTLCPYKYNHPTWYSTASPHVLAGVDGLVPACRVFVSCMLSDRGSRHHQSRCTLKRCSYAHVTTSRDCIIK